MNAQGVATSRAVLTVQYGLALRSYLEGAGEAALARAYELGRLAIAEGWGVLDIAMIHHEALAEQMAAEGGGDAERLCLGGQFLAESLTPFEMNLRAYQDNARLLGLGASLQRENAEIERSREQLHTILDATTALIYMKEASGRFLFANAPFVRVFRVDREEIHGKLGADFLPPEVAATLEADDARVLQDGVPSELEECVAIDGDERTYLSVKFPLLDAQGHPHALCCVATDITDRKRADSELREAKAAIEVAHRELESFSYSVAHDLRAPLRSIDGFSQAIIEDCVGQLDDQGQRYLGHIRDSVLHMADLIEDLLALARLTRAELRRRRVDVTELVRDITVRYLEATPSRQVEVAIADGVVAHADPTLLRAVLENLLGNAWKFTSKVDRAHIAFDTREDGQETVYRVRDNGAGFDMAHAAKLFGAFQRLHAARDFEGTGVGLATVQRIVHRHGGRVWAEAEVGKGATFSFTLGRGEMGR